MGNQESATAAKPTDSVKSPEFVSPVQGTLGQPAQGVARFAVAVSATEALLSFGNTQQVLNPLDQNPTQASIVHWQAVYSLSPIVAKQLAQALVESLKLYEQNFGTIPVDPNFKVIGG